MNRYCESMKCTGFCGSNDCVTLPEVILHCNRSVILDIRRYVMFAVAHSDDMDFIRDGVYLYDALEKVLDDHLKILNEEDED